LINTIYLLLLCLLKQLGVVKFFLLDNIFFLFLTFLFLTNYIYNIIMANSSIVKKRIVTNFNNLSSDLQTQVKLRYPTGFSDSMIRIDKPDGSFFYAVSYDTSEISYLVKINVKIDEAIPEDDYGDYYDQEMKDPNEMSNSSDNNDDLDVMEL